MSVSVVPRLLPVENFEPGQLYLNYGGGDGNRLALPIADGSGNTGGRALILTDGKDAFRDRPIDPERSLLIQGAVFLIDEPVLGLQAGRGALVPGCLAPTGDGFAIATSAPFDETEWLEVASGVSSETRSHRYYFDAWHISVFGPGGQEIVLYRYARPQSD